MRAPECVCLKGILFASSLKSLPPAPAIMIPIITIIIIILISEPPPLHPVPFFPPHLFTCCSRPPHSDILSPAPWRHVCQKLSASRAFASACLQDNLVPLAAETPNLRKTILKMWRFFSFVWKISHYYKTLVCCFFLSQYTGKVENFSFTLYIHFLSYI